GYDGDAPAGFGPEEFPGEEPGYQWEELAEEAPILGTGSRSVAADAVSPHPDPLPRGEGVIVLGAGVPDGPTASSVGEEDTAYAVAATGATALPPTLSQGEPASPLPLGEAARRAGEGSDVAGQMAQSGASGVHGSNGNGNGHRGNGNGDGSKAAQNGQTNGRKAANGRKPCHLRIFLARRGTDEQDVDLLRRVYQALSAWHGEDSYELCVETCSGRAVLESPDARTALNPELEADLKEILGPDCLTVCDVG
ncbi:MAG: hypothetical protein M1582_03115, partial [Actinobacteria bacterium]|nr:hypothetical protein [Actinomycetota bacterium]